MVEAESPGRLYGNRQNERIHNNIQAELQYVQFTFAQNMNKFMNDRSLRHNTDIYRAMYWRLCLNLLTYILPLRSI